MKIIFIFDKKERNIRLPLCMLTLFTQFLPVDKEKLTKKAIRDILKMLKAYKKRYGSFVLLDVEENNLKKFKIVI